MLCELEGARPGVLKLGTWAQVPQLSHPLSTGDPSPARREGVKKKAAEYLKRAEEILHLHLSPVPP